MDQSVLWLGKKSGLGGCIFGIVKVAETDADEAEALLRLQGNAVA